MSDEAINSLVYGLNIATTAQIDADNANRRANEAETRAMQAELEAASKTTDRDLERRLDEANMAERLARHSYEVIKTQLAEKEALLTEWMHGFEAYKRVVTKYSKLNGLDKEQMIKDINREIVDLAEEDPRFKDTNLGSDAKKELGLA